MNTKKLTEEELGELNALVEQNGGVLTPESVLLKARDPHSALHDRFTWDDEHAANLRRLDEARSLIMKVRVKIQARAEEPPISVRAFVSLANDRVAGGGYRPVEVVLSDPSMRAELLRTALAELAALKKRYANLSELANVFAEIDQAQAQRKAG